MAADPRPDRAPTALQQWAEAVGEAAGGLYRDHVRPRLPGRPVVYAGLPAAPEVKAGDRWVPEGWVPHDVADAPGYEATLVAELRRHVRPGDRVVVVGGGAGVTAAAAALAAGPDGRVRVFEGSATCARDVARTAALNGVGDRVAVEHAVVAGGSHVYDGHPGRPVAPADLPACDVLELDCEGAEVAILEGLAVRPRVLLVETHGVYGAPTDRVLALVERLGYDATDAGLAEPRVAELHREADVHVVVGVRRAPAAGRWPPSDTKSASVVAGRGGRIDPP